MRGLCGTLTWTQRDDFTTPEGDVENSVSSFAGKFTTEQCSMPGGPLPDACTTFTQRREYAETMCSVIHTAVFQVCSVKFVIFCHCPLFLTCPAPFWFCRGVTMWWRGNTTFVSVCQRFVVVLLRGRVTAPSSLPMHNTVLRKAPLYTGVIIPFAVSGGFIVSYCGTMEPNEKC